MRKIIALVLSLCMLLGSAALADAAFTPGTYVGTGDGFGGVIEAEVTVDENAITAIKLTGEGETPDIGGKAIPQFEEAYIGKSAADAVDAVSGATMTSGGVKVAVEKALAKAAAGGAEEEAPAATISFTPGTYEATAEGYN